MSVTKIFSISRYKRILLTLLFVPCVLLIDSSLGDEVVGHGQNAANFMALLGYLWVYKRSTKRVREVMLVGAFVGLAGEVFFSMGLGMYHYRLGHVPAWLAFGHSLLYSLVYKLSHDKWFKKNQKMVQSVLIGFAVSYSVFWLYVANDWYGFLCTVVFFVILFFAKKSRLFFLIMFAVVCYIEQVGTATGCWYWPETMFNQDNWLASGNPPSGVAVFYFMFDAAVLWIYLNILHPNTKIRYKFRKDSFRNNQFAEKQY